MSLRVKRHGTAIPLCEVNAPPEQLNVPSPDLGPEPRLGYTAV